jgi:hypothetical protein
MLTRLTMRDWQISAVCAGSCRLLQLLRSRARTRAQQVLRNTLHAPTQIPQFLAPCPRAERSVLATEDAMGFRHGVQPRRQQRPLP